MFVRYAYPPNALGYCGPDGTARRLPRVRGGRRGRPGWCSSARAFLGAWPYLELIWPGSGISDPLDHRVVEAYWVGNHLLDRVPRPDRRLPADRFRQRVGSNLEFLAEGVLADAVPHHSFHVFGVYPWVGLLGDDRAAHPLTVLDRCRIRWGQVIALDGAGQSWVLGRSPGTVSTWPRASPPGDGPVGLDGTVAGSCRDLGPGTWCRCTGTGSATGSPTASSARYARTPCATWTWSTTAWSAPAPSPSSADFR